MRPEQIETEAMVLAFMTIAGGGRRTIVCASAEDAKAIKQRWSELLGELRGRTAARPIDSWPVDLEITE